MLQIEKYHTGRKEAVVQISETSLRPNKIVERERAKNRAIKYLTIYFRTKNKEIL